MNNMNNINSTANNSSTKNSNSNNTQSLNQNNLYQASNNKTYNSSSDNNQKKTLKETVKENISKKDFQNKNSVKSQSGSSNLNLENNLNLNLTPSLNTGSNQRHNSNSININNDIFLDNFDFDNPSSNLGPVFKNNFSGSLSNPVGYSSHPMKDKKLTRTDLLNLEKEYSDVKKDQIELKEKLHAYQKEFYQIHNRRVKYYKDIIGIEGDYQRYKINKLKIKEIQEIILKYKNNK